MTPDELMERCEQFLRDNTGNLYIDGNNDPDEESVALLESLCREMIAVGLESAGYRAETVAFLMGNDRWKERNALNEYAGACHQEAQRLKHGEGPLAG